MVMKIILRVRHLSVMQQCLVEVEIAVGLGTEVCDYI